MLLAWLVHRVWCVCHIQSGRFVLCLLWIFDCGWSKETRLSQARPGQLWDDPDVVFFSSATLLITLEMTGWSTEPRVWAWFDNPFANRLRRFGWNTDRVCASWFQYVGLAYCEITKAIFLEGGRYHQRRIWMLMLHVFPKHMFFKLQII